MDPCPNYRHVVSATARHCPLGQCAVCSSGSALVRMEFADVVRRSWSSAELDILTKAARAALL